MIPRVRSLSKCGLIIERILGKNEKKQSDDRLDKLLQKRMKPRVKKRVIKKQGLDAVVGRQVQSTYQKCMTAQASKVTYENKKHILFMKQPQYSVRHEKRQRLEVFEKEQWKAGRECKRHKSAANTPKHNIMTARDLQTHRTAFHTLDFHKQTPRPFDQQIKQLKEKKQKIDFYTPPNSFLRAQSVHAFESYSKRSFLQNNERAGETLGAEGFKVNPEKYKGSWKVVGAPSFSKSTDKHLNRYDRDCPPWNPKLNYYPKEQKRINSVSFATLTARKENLVKSAYPFRIAI